MTHQQRGPHPAEVDGSVVERALRLIRPKSERSCVVAIRERVSLLRRVAEELNRCPSPGDLKKELKTLEKDMKRARTAMRLCSMPCRSMVFFKDAKREAAFFQELDQLVESAKFHQDALVVRRGSRKWDNVKALAAKYAYDLLRSFSDRPLTKASGGPFYRLASVLYEAASGKKSNLEQYCRQILDGVDRFEPAVIVRIPFAKS
jgi:hypothetical protein